MNAVPSPPLPGWWSARWAADPGAEILRVAGPGDLGSTGWIRAGELEERTRAAARRLQGHGVVPGDRVLWSAQRSAESVVAALGILRLGSILVPVNPEITGRELRHVVGDVEPRLAIVDEPGPGAQRVVEGLAELAHGRGGVPAVGAAVPEAPMGSAPAPVLDGVGGSDLALVVYTSGTTGRPKGAMLTHANLAAGVSSLIEAWHWTPSDRLSLALPLFHVHGLVAGLFGSLASGGSVVVFPRFDPGEVLASPERHGATMFFGVPTMYHRLVATEGVERLGALRLCVSGSAALPADLWTEVRRRTGVAVLERYGMTETLLTMSNPYEGERRPGTVGFPLPGARSTLSPDGELLVAGPTVFAGYWRQPEATAACYEGEWFRTGDLARLDDDGYLVIRGRAKELIISGGYNVYPAEVEDVLSQHPDIAEVAVAGLPSKEWGETVAAWVVPTPGAAASPEAASVLSSRLQEFAAGQLAPYKCPREVHVVAALPRNALGKIQRHELGRPL